MKLLENLNSAFRPPVITRQRIFLALGLAVIADGLQLCLGIFGWEGLDQVIDLVTMILVLRLIGFHVLLLPTFVVELIPLLDDLPTWTACVIAVVAFRKREQNQPPPGSPAKPVIDI